jgi:Dual specificity phosphatase, catalytic domain
MSRTWSRSPVFLAAGGMALCGCVGLVYFAVEQWTREEPNYSRIEEGLYLGGYVREPPPGTRAVLNLCETADRYHGEVHVWEPIRDAEPAPDIDWLRRMVKWMDQRRQSGMTTYVHCRNGVSRSGMVVTAYVMFKHKWTRDAALAFVQQQRPITRPNPAFMRRLIEWERIVRDP